VYDFGKQLTYECERGYVFHNDGGNSELRITCEENGVWRGQVTDCVPIECPAPSAFEHGWVTLKTHHGDTANPRRQNSSSISNDGIVYIYGSETEASCTLGYRLVGPVVRECLENGEWSSAEPRCEQVTCDLSTLILFSDLPMPITENGAFNVSGNFYGDLADFICKPGYRLTLPMFSNSWSLMKLTWTCQMNGSWVLFNNIDTGSEFMDAVLKRGQSLCQPFQYKCPEPKVRALHRQFFFF
jgi:CUB/sushi domain-containing protein